MEKMRVKDILNNILNEKDREEDISEKQKFEILTKEKIDKDIYYYLETMFNKVNIEVLGQYEGNLIDLMKRGKLEGWCWETTETAALFMPDDVIIYRANLHFNKYKTYYHSFIQFTYKDQNYIFDPCLYLINTKDLYFKTFDVDIKGQTTSKEIKDYFLNHISNNPEKEIIVYGEEDPSSPMYRNGSGYKNIDVENNKIKSLTVHYYMNA